MDARDIKPEDNSRPMLEHGIIAKDVPDFATLAQVILPEFDPALVWGPCRWQARNDIDLPHKGDTCLVAFSNRREPWIIAWWPF